jgi:hypothetical protein
MYLLVPTPTPPPAVSTCLAETGVDATPLVILAVLAVVLLAAGVLALRTSRARIALVLLPVALLALAFGGVATANPAQAAPPAQKIADFTVSDTWTYDDPDFTSEPASVASLEKLAQLEDWVIEYGTLTSQVVIMTTEDGTESADATAAINGYDSATATFRFDDELLEDVASELGFGLLTLTVQVTWPYFDECAKPISTVTTWTGTIDYRID